MSNKKTSTADQVDNHRRLLFLSMFLLSLIFAVKTGFYVAGNELQGFLEIAGKSLFGLFAVVFIATVYWKLRFIPRKERYLLTSAESFASQAMHQGFKISWLLTFVLLVFFTVTTKKDHSYFPTEFYLNLALFFMLAVFSVSFFFLFQGGDKEQKAGQ